MVHRSSESDSDIETSPLVLIADDDPAIRLVLKHSVEQIGYRVIEASDGQQAVAMTRDQRPDLILMDAIMPEQDGFSATAEITGSPELSDIPIMIITALDDDHSVDRAFEVGALDYITKPVKWSVLKQRVRRMIHAAVAEKKIRHLAYHDTLTGLPNRMLFMDRIEQAIARMDRTREAFALLFIDIDHFKIINDTLGHDAGDKLLRSVTQRLRDIIRQTDTVARFGGDEFTVLLENIQKPEDTVLVTDKLLRVLHEPIIISGRDVRISASVGIAVYPQDGGDFGTLLKHADTAMYEAKQLGRNNFQFYTKSMSESAQKRLDLEASLREAISSEAFRVYYQPKYELDTGQCWGMEALIRWSHPEKGLIPPVDFIPVAEETGMIIPISEWMIRECFRQMVSWRQSGLQVANLSINISPRQFKEQDLVGLFAELLHESEIRGEDIEIEITETILLENQVKAASTLGQLKAMGIKIALDDFGTGYASLAYLKKYPIDIVKIDRSFVAGTPDDEEDCAIVRAIASLASALEKDLVAEGVENEEQIEFLKQVNCNKAQGFYWNPPLSAHAFQINVLEKIADD